MRIFLFLFVLTAFAHSEVILQFFEGEWDEIHARTPEIAEIGYDGIWIPSPCKSPMSGSIKWANVGYSLYDRFDLGDIPQRGTVATRYGDRGELRHMVDHLHESDVKVYPDIVFNHNGNGPNMFGYPGMLINDFHAWPDGSQPGGWRRAPRMTGYDDISDGYGQTFQQELVSLIDVVTEHDGRFGVPEPAPFVRHPGQFDKYPFHNPGDTLPNENVREMMNRWAHWLGDAMDYDGFRLDAGKHVVREFYGGPGETGKFLHEAQWNFDQRRGNAYDGTVPDLYTNEVRRKDMLMFNEIFAGGADYFDYWRDGNNKMRYLDFPAKIQLVDNAFNNGNLGVLGSVGVNLDPTEGVMFVQSHDQPGPSNLDLAYAWLLTKVGVPIVYFSGNNISWDDKNSGRTWVLPGTDNALGDTNNVVPNLVYIHNQFARGREWNRWADGDFYAHERYQDLNSNENPDQGEGLLLVALNDSGSDQTRTLQTAFPPFTALKDYTGNQPTVVTVNGSGQVTITVPARGGQGFVCYAPHVAEGPGSGEALRFTSGGSPVPEMDWIVPGGRDQADKPRTLPRITTHTVDIEIHYTDPGGSGLAVSNGIVKWGGGRDLNVSATDFTDHSSVMGGYEQATYDGGSGAWKLTADLTGVPEGLHTVRGRLFSSIPSSGATFYQTFSKTVYVDRSGPDLVVSSPADAESVPGETIAVIENPDRTASLVEVSTDGGSNWVAAIEVQRGLWKASLTGLSDGAQILEVRATETDLGSPATTLQTSTASRSFSVATPALAFSMNHADEAVIQEPFFATTLTVPGGTTLGQVKLYWDGYEMTGLSLDGTTVSHTFDGRFTAGGVEQRLSGAFTNGPHFFEAVLDNGVDVRRLARRVVFNLYGANLTDSDGDGLPDDVELPGFTAGDYATQHFPGDGNEDTIPNYGEYWPNTNPLNEDTNYDGPWDGDEDWDGDGVTNLTEVKRGFLDHGSAFHYNIYDAGSTPPSSVASTATWTLTPAAGDTTDMAITYRPNDGPLSGAGSIEVVVSIDGGVLQYLAMTDAGGGNWTYTVNLPNGSSEVDLFFQVPGGATTDMNLAWEEIDVTYTGPAFAMDGLLDSANYLVAGNGMNIWAAVRGGKLYFATWSTDGGSNDHFLLCTNNFGNPEAHPWSKDGVLNFWFDGWPWLAADGTFHALNNGGASGASAMGTGGNVVEGEIDLVEVFGSVPDVLYFSALSYGDNNGDGINGQCPAPWDADNNLSTPEYAAVRVDSIRDEDADGHHDGGAPVFESTVNGDTADANYGLRRFFIDELAGDSESITFEFTPNHNPGETLSNVELITNLNRREHAVIQEDRDTVTTSSGTYFRAHAMTDNAGTWEVTLPVTTCGAYRATVRYQLDGETHYFTDGGLRRDLAIVVSPSTALDVNMYEVNPAIVEATSDDFSGRSTFSNLWMADASNDYVNVDHFLNLGVNMLWLQPIHPIGVEARGEDPDTLAPYEPGSPYAVRDYWQIAPALGADNTEAGALGEFQTAVAEFDTAGIGVMMDGTFNHSSPDAVLGQGAADLFGWAVSTGTEIRNQKPQWYSKEGNFLLPASNAAEVAVAPDRSDFGKWTDVRDFYFGNYDALVKYSSASHQQEFLLERDELEPLSADTVELWEYFAYYPLYWLDKTGHPAGTPAAESYKGIDGLRCDFAQGLPSEFWEYCINKTRSRKWDFLFMAESLDGYREVDGSKRHGVGYRSARHFDILNENIVFHWRDTHFDYPANGPGTGGPGDRTTGATYEAYKNRREAYENVVLLNNLTSHDEVFPSDHPYEMLQAYAQLGSLDGIPMMMYGQEAGAQNDHGNYAFNGVVLNADHNFARYEDNFGKNIPNFKRWNDMTNIWANRDWTIQELYGRINRARLLSPAIRGKNEYILDRTSGLGRDPDIFAVAKYEQAGLHPSQQQVVFCFANTNYMADDDRSATFDLSPSQFGIESAENYNAVDLLAADPTAFVWGSDRTGADLIANGIPITLDQPVTSLGQAKYLRLVDTSVPLDSDSDGLPDTWEDGNGLDKLDPADPFDDDDGDGQWNVAEFNAGTDPQDPNSRLKATATSRTATGMLVTWASVPGRTYRIEWTDDFGMWQPLLDGGIPVTVPASAGSTTSYEIPLETPPPARRIFRIAVP